MNVQDDTVIRDLSTGVVLDTPRRGRSSGQIGMQVMRMLGYFLGCIGIVFRCPFEVVFLHLMFSSIGEAYPSNETYLDPLAL